MDELAKTEARNYLTAAGFFVMAAFVLPSVLSGTFPSATIQLATGLGLLLIGTLLIILRKRDMIAILFMMFSIYHISIGFLPGFVGFPILFCFSGLILLTLLVTLTGKDKAKWLLILLPLVMIVCSLIGLLSGIDLTDITAIEFWIQFAICIYFALVCASERLHLPGRKLLTADEETDFKASGSVLGYLLFAAVSGMYALYYIVGESMMNAEYMHTINIVAAVLFIFIAVLLFTVGKMRFTPAMFLLLGLTNLLAMYSSPGVMFIGAAILFIIIGIFAMLRKESRILPGIMLVLYGCTFFFSGFAGGNTPVVSVILNAIPCLIAIYLAFVVYSQKKLPKF